MSDKVFIVDGNGVISAYDYQELCNLYAVQTTTPFGVRRTDFYRAVAGYETYRVNRGLLDVQAEWYRDYDEAIAAAAEYNADNYPGSRWAVRAATRYELRSYNCNGSSRRHMLVETEREAIEWLDNCAQIDFANHADAPIAFSSQEEAQQYLQERGAEK